LKSEASVGLDMAAEEQDTERTAVKTYVPAYQRDAWDDHAAKLDMSRSEFVRSMVQAGRKGFDPGGSDPETGLDEDTSQPPPEGTEAPDFETYVRESLRAGPRSWDELHAELTAEIEAELEDVLERLQEQNEVRYSGRDGGYVLAE
jgi:hypothetical protein